MSAAQGSRRCSQLSSTSNVRSSASAAISCSTGCSPGDAMRSHRGQHRRCRRAAGSVTPASSTNQTPPGKRSSSSAATASARRVLPTPPEPGEGDEPLVDDELADRDDIVLPPDERSELHREVVTVRVERPKRSLSDGKVRVNHLPHALGTTKVLQPVRTEVGDVRAIGQLIGDQSGGGVGHEDLVAVPDRSKAGAADHRLAEVVALVAQLGFAGVDRHPHMERPRRQARSRP